MLFAYSSPVENETLVMDCLIYREATSLLLSDFLGVG